MQIYYSDEVSMYGQMVLRNESDDLWNSVDT